MLPCYPGFSVSEWQRVRQNEKQKLPLWLNDCTLGRGSRGRGPVTDFIYFVSIWEFYIHVKFSNWDNINTIQLQFRRQRRDETKHRVDHETQHIPDNAFFSVITFCASQCTAELRELTRVAEVVRGPRRKVWTRTKILSPNIRYFVGNQYLSRFT